ncbi:MAG: SH3 domain-containing protein [Anaerolineae bacterium]|nr:SH3 domain-containing protein [Anaerolineae bacterium]
MVKRFVVVLLFSLAASIYIMPARAAGTPWTAWLYEDQLGRMTQVDSNGTMLKQIQLPSGTGEGYSRNIAVSQDGGLVAYGGTSTSTNNVYIFNLATNQNLFEFNVPQNANTSFEFGGDALSYSENNGTFAFSYGGVGIQWTLVVIDIKTLSASSLKQSDPAAASLADTGISFLPFVTYNRNNQITFMMIPYGTDGAPSYKAFTWNRDTNSVAPNAIYTEPDSATFLPTNEVISTISDDAFPGSRLPDTDFPVTNTLQVFDPKVNQRFIVTPLPGIYNPRFIQGGERVAVSHDYVQSDGTQIQSLLVVERSGVSSSPVNGVRQTSINGVLGTQDGFIFSSSSGSDPKSNGTSLFYVATRGINDSFNAVPVWSSPPGVNGRLVWVSDSAAAPTTTFSPWGQVQAPPTATGNSVYAVGVTATVQTTNNDVLNLRNGPGLTFQRLGLVPNGTIVTLIEGPQNADGLIWWRIRLPNGTEGWVVTQIDGITTLVPQ